MELKDFIKSAIASISDGILEAQTELKDKGVVVNPEYLSIKEDKKSMDSLGSRYIEEISFEVQVGVDETTSDSVKGQAGLKVIFNASIEGDHGNVTKSSQTNILRFKIPVAFPYTDLPEKFKNKNGGLRSSLSAATLVKRNNYPLG